MAKFLVDFMVTVEVDVIDPRVIDRCVNNEAGWREHYYDISTAEQVAEHLAYNYARNDADVNQLDGWADLASGAVRCVCRGWELERVEAVP